MRVLHIEHDLDAARVEGLRSTFEDLATANENITLDLSKVRFIDSSGVGAIVFLFKRLRMRGLTLVVANTHGQPHRLLIHLHLTFLFASPQHPSAA